MKKILSLAIPFALAVGFVSCQKESGLSGKEFQQELAPDATLTIGFGIQEDARTKAEMADDPTIESIHVLVFDNDTHILLQTCRAILAEKTVNKNYGDESATGANDVTISSWKVEGVMMSDKSRALHFIANIADDDVPVAGSETSIFQSLTTSENKVSYWQRVVVPEILPYVYDGSGEYSFVGEDGVLKVDQPVVTDGSGVAADGSYKDVNGYVVSKGDYIDYTSAKIINGTGYYASESASSKLTNIRLVRNFARIKFKNEWNGFTLNKIALVNTPKAGLVAPYSAAGFPAAYTNLTDTNPIPVIGDLSGYSPLLPAEGINPNATDLVPVGSTQEVTLFMYERAIPTSLPTSVLIGGALTGASATEKDADGNTWFKVEVALESGAYFPVLRDFTYNMSLKSIDASAARHASAQDALDSAPVGDISNSPETATLNQITDGKGLMLYVQYIDDVVMDNTTVRPLLYTFVYESGGSKTYFNNAVTFTAEAKPGSTLPAATGTTIETSSDVSAYSDLIPDSNYTWYVALVPINTKSDANPILQSDVVVTGKITAEANPVPGYTKELTRRVTYTVMGQQKLGLTTSGVSSNAAGNQTTLTIKLPNSFGPSVFPITLKIEAEDNNLAPDATVANGKNLSVESGESAFTAGKNTFYFLKTISYSDYKNASANGYEFACVFQTTKGTGHNTPVTNIRVTQKLEGSAASRFLGGADATVQLLVGSQATNN